MKLDVEQFQKDIIELSKNIPFILIWVMYLLYQVLKKKLSNSTE